MSACQMNLDLKAFKKICPNIVNDHFLLTMNQNITLLPATDKDLATIKSLLKQDNLPDADINTDSINFFKLISDKSEIGISGIELFGNLGLLRSVVINKKYRGQDFGKMLIASTEEKAKQLNLKYLYLLTTTADGFFNKMGYQKLGKTHAPEAIKNSNEFSNLCPDSAVLMVKKMEV